MHNHRKFKSGTVTISVAYGYDLHKIVMAKSTYDRISAGKEVRRNGQGFYTCQGREQDEWNFNITEPGSLYICTVEGRDIYFGNMDDGEVRVKVELPE